MPNSIDTDCVYGIVLYNRIFACLRRWLLLSLWNTQWNSFDSLFSHEYPRNQEICQTVLCRITTIAYNSLIEHYFGWKRVYETNLSIEVSVNFFSISFESFQAHLIELYLPNNTHTENMVPWTKLSDEFRMNTTCISDFLCVCSFISMFFHATTLNSYT